MLQTALVVRLNKLDNPSWLKYSAFVGSSAKMGHLPFIRIVATSLPENASPQPVYVTVCRPGVGVIQFLKSNRRSTDLPADDPACTKPTYHRLSTRRGRHHNLIWKRATDLPADDPACKPKIPTATCIRPVRANPGERAPDLALTRLPLPPTAQLLVNTPFGQKNNARGAVVPQQGCRQHRHRTQQRRSRHQR